jgi:hypothetical protein
MTDEEQLKIVKYISGSQAFESFLGNLAENIKNDFKEIGFYQIALFAYCSGYIHCLEASSE